MSNVKLPITISRHNLYGVEEGTYLRVQSLDILGDFKPCSNTQYIGLSKDKLVLTIDCEKLSRLDLLSKVVSEVTWLGEVKCYPKNTGIIYYLPKCWFILPKSISRGNPYKAKAMVETVVGRKWIEKLHLLKVGIPDGDTSASYQEEVSGGI